MLEAISWLTILGKILYPQTMKTIELLSGQSFFFLNFS